MGFITPSVPFLTVLLPWKNGQSYTATFLARPHSGSSQRAEASRQRRPRALHARGSRPTSRRKPSAAARRSTCVLTEPSTTVTLHAAEITFGEVTITSGGQTQTARVTPDAKRETATLTVPAADRRGPGDDPDHLHRHPQRQAARLLHQQGQRTEVRRVADGSHRRAARVSLVRRARLQGDLRHLADDRRAATRRSPTAGSSRTRRARAGQAHGDVRDERRRCPRIWSRCSSATSSAAKARPMASRSASARRPTSAS